MRHRDVRPKARALDDNEGTSGAEVNRPLSDGGLRDPDTREALEYLSGLLPQLCRMADRSDENLLAYLLEMARLEADHRVATLSRRSRNSA